MHNILFICDEVQTGYGRTGTDLAYQHESGVQPDLVALGKAVTGGKGSASQWWNKISNNFRHLSHVNNHGEVTCYGSP